MKSKIGLKRGTVVLEKHHEEWAREFKKEKKRLQKLLGETVLDIQHIGSTSIPNLSAKPIIDMLMGVRHFSDISKMQKVLENIGYEYRENGSSNVQVFFAKGPEKNRTHYLHITELGSSEWKNSIFFRNHLLLHSEEVKKYEKIKQKLAKQYSDKRDKYTSGKKDYIENILKKNQNKKKE